MNHRFFRWVLPLMIGMVLLGNGITVFAEQQDAKTKAMELFDTCSRFVVVPDTDDESCAMEMEVELKFGGKDNVIQLATATMPGCGLVKLNIPGLAALKYVYGNNRPWLAGDEGVFFLGDTKESFEEFRQKHPDWNAVYDETVSMMSAFLPLVQGMILKSSPTWEEDRLYLDKGIYATFTKNGLPDQLVFDIKNKAQGKIQFKNWAFGKDVDEGQFIPPVNTPTATVCSDDIYRGIIALGSFGIEKLGATFNPQKSTTDPQKLQIVARDKQGHGLLCRHQGKRVLIVEGTPEQMGAAQGDLLKNDAFKLVAKILYASGTGASISKKQWFMETMEAIEKRTTAYIPERFFREMDAMSDAMGISRRDGRYANLFPELFHCSGVAVRGSATVDGRVIHARVLDYMRELLIQSEAAVQVFIPKDHYAWISQGYAGFVGTVTAMNEHGLAMGEMGGKGEGDWDGLPMSLLMREIMETCKTVEDAVELMKKTPRTCEYYYVLSDAKRNMVAIRAVPDEVLIFEPGEQHERLPFVPEDTVLISGGDRAKALSAKLVEHHGKIDVPLLIEIIKRPVSMNSNLHNAVFSPETLEIWVSDAGDDTLACDENYAKFNLKDLVELYRTTCGAADRESFRLILMPDTQIYAESFPEIFDAQTKWVAENPEKVAFVLQQGDITNRNVEPQWKVAVAAMNRLDGVVPYTLAMGNHDIGKNGSSDIRDTTFFNMYFPYEKFSQRQEFGGAFEEGKMDNVWFTFQAGGWDWLILTLEFGPRNCVMDWAEKIVQDHPKHKVIINTHAYMYSDETRMQEGKDHKWLPQGYGFGKETGENAVNNGEQMWEKLVGRYPNIMFVFSGHVLNDGTGLLVSEGEHGNKVYQMLANYQMKENGGNGFLRILDIAPGQNRVDVKTYSPLLDRYMTEPDQQFVLEDVSFE